METPINHFSLKRLMEDNGYVDLKLIKQSIDPDIEEVQRLLKIERKSGYPLVKIKMHFLPDPIKRSVRCLEDQLCDICSKAKAKKNVMLNATTSYLVYAIDKNGKIGLLNVRRQDHDMIVDALVKHAVVSNEDPFHLDSKLVLRIHGATHARFNFKIVSNVEIILDRKFPKAKLEEIQDLPLISEIYPKEWSPKIKKLVSNL